MSQRDRFTRGYRQGLAWRTHPGPAPADPAEAAGFAAGRRDAVMDSYRLAKGRPLTEGAYTAYLQRDR